MRDKIISTSNKNIKNVRELLSKAKTRRETGLFVAEGERICKDLPVELIETLYVSESYRGELPFSKDSDKLIPVSDEVMHYMSDTKTEQGILAVVRQKTYQKLQGDFFLLLETIQDPGNLGTIFRTAEAAGVSGILMNQSCADLFAPKVVRSTMGAIWRVPYLIAEDLKAEAEKLKQKGVQVYAAHLKGQKTHFACDFHGPCAFLIGNEGNGLTDELASVADTYLRIPMEGCVESLNAAVAATVLMYETVRQRSELIERK